MYRLTAEDLVDYEREFGIAGHIPTGDLSWPRYDDKYRAISRLIEEHRLLRAEIARLRAAEEEVSDMRERCYVVCPKRRDGAVPSIEKAIGSVVYFTVEDAKKAAKDLEKMGLCPVIVELQTVRWREIVAAVFGEVDGE